MGIIGQLPPTPRLVTYAGWTGQADFGGRGLLTLDTQGSLQFWWAHLRVGRDHIAGSFTEKHVLGEGLGDVRALAGVLRRNRLSHPGLVLVRGDGRLEYHPVSMSRDWKEYTLGAPRVIATGLSHASALAIFSDSTEQHYWTTVVVADQGQLVQYRFTEDAEGPVVRRVLVADGPRSPKTLRQACSFLPGGDRHGALIAYDEQGHGQMFAGPWDEQTGEGELTYIGTTENDISGEVRF
ncbi:hypothetical protein KEM60_01841 [Austwickia sp. TVS 96-490-7B]|uniref:hypothetical protein n=1 Tax=Austwickia sp. TVS 96-490-7B TaxID=2830843 RepID=UPI001C589AA3|nr:hypothetical protein [Austwickia sp. TVS 96-490-7B]MBW3085637.1 hypothetical protein [Austwickia sp. TVS 96-490-7B]